MPYYRRAFLLDDDPAALFLLEDTLSQAQLAGQLFSFSRFVELLPVFVRLSQDAKQTDLPDLLLLDVHMPGWDGLEVLEALLDIPGIGGSKVCVFLISASYHPALAQKIKQYPISGYLIKPLGKEAIAQLIGSARQEACELKE